MSNQLDGGRPLPWNRDQLGRFVREAWVRWALTQPSPKPSWLVPYDELREPDKEADRQIGEAVARWVTIGDAVAFTELEAELAAAKVRIGELEGSAVPANEHEDQCSLNLIRRTEKSGGRS